MRRRRRANEIATALQAPLHVELDAQLRLPEAQHPHNRVKPTPQSPTTRVRGGNAQNARQAPQKLSWGDPVLGIDPGSKVCGWALIAYGSEFLIDSGSIKPKGQTADDRLPALRDAIVDLARRAAAVVYEQPFRVGNAGDQVLPQVVGVIRLAAYDAGLPVSAIHASAARRIVCGYGSVDKNAVHTYLSVLYDRELRDRDRGLETADESDAVCIALAAVRSM